jgi:rRNA processing protein Gar1
VRFLGEVVKVTRSRNFLVKLKPPLKEDLKGFKVLLDDLSLVGIVSDIIGPVHEPYALVKILIPLEKAKDLIGRRVYLAEKGDERILKHGEDRLSY